MRTAFPWQVGQLVAGRYHVRGINTEGGMAIVHFVWHTSWNMELVLKSPRPDLFVEQTARERFAHEAETWVDLGLHPNIVSAFYVRHIDDLPRIILEKMDGGSLKAWLAQSKVANLATSLDIAIQIACGLAYVHTQRPDLVHRDLKPANVLLTPTGQAKVTDFGLVGAVGFQVGTPAYMAPEMWLDPEHVTSAADLYSFGVMLYEILAGRRPFERGDTGTSLGAVRGGKGVEGSLGALRVPEKSLQGTEDQASLGGKVSIERGNERSLGEVTALGSSGELLTADLEYFRDAHTQRNPEPPRRYNSSISRELDELCMRLLSKRAEDRPASAQEVAAALQGIYARCVGDTYPRTPPQQAELLADSLNNKALSLLDLEKPQLADELWQQAVALRPNHPQATYNQGLLRWRSGRTTDETLVSNLEQLALTDGRAWDLAAAVHLERGDVEAARRCLGQVSGEGSTTGRFPELTKPDEARSEFGRFLKQTYDGHTRDVSAVAVTPDGTRGLSCAYDGSVCFWDLANGELLRACDKARGFGNAVVLAPDARTGFVATEQGDVQVWSLGTGQRVGQLVRAKEQSPGAACLALASVSRHLFAGCADGRLRIWDLTSLQLVSEFGGHQGAVTCVSVSPDGMLVASGGADQTVRVWDVETGRCLRTFEGHTTRVAAIALIPGLRQVVSAGKGGIIPGDRRDLPLRLWDVDSGRAIGSLEGHGSPVACLAASADGAAVLAGGGSGTIVGEDYALRLWDIRSRRCLRTFDGGSPWRAVAVCPDGKRGLSACGHSVCVWELSPQTVWSADFALVRPAGYKETLTFARKATQLRVEADELLQKGAHARAAQCIRQARGLPGHDRNPELLDRWWSARTAARRTTLRDAWPVRRLGSADASSGVIGMVVSRDGRSVLAGSEDGKVRLWDLTSGDCRLVLDGDGFRVWSVALSDDGKLAASGESITSAVKLWDLESGKEVRTLGAGGPGTKRSLAFTPDGQTLVAADKYGGVVIWDVATGECRKTLATDDEDEGGRSTVVCVALSRSGRLGISGERSGRMQLWDLEAGQCLRAWKGKPVEWVALSPDGCLAVSGGIGGTVQVWETASGRSLANLYGHRQAMVVRAVALSPDGTAALSAGDDETVRLWDLTTGQCLRTLSEGHHRPIYSVAFTRSGRHVVSGGMDGHIWIWELDWELEFPDAPPSVDVARPFLEAFILRHRVRPDPTSGTVAVSHEAWRELLAELADLGLALLAPQAIKRELNHLAHQGVSTTPPRELDFKFRQGLSGLGNATPCEGKTVWYCTCFACGERNFFGSAGAANKWYRCDSCRRTVASPDELTEEVAAYCPCGTVILCFDIREPVVCQHCGRALAVAVAAG